MFMSSRLTTGRFIQQRVIASPWKHDYSRHWPSGISDGSRYSV